MSENLKMCLYHHFELMQKSNLLKTRIIKLKKKNNKAALLTGY